MTAVKALPCAGCRELFPPEKLHAYGRLTCSGCAEASPVVKTEMVVEHLVHFVKAAPHLAVCSCGETFHPKPFGETARHVWAAHLTEALNVALRAAGGR